MNVFLCDLAVNLRCGLCAMLLRRIALDEVRINADQLLGFAALTLLGRLLPALAATGMDGYLNAQGLAVEVTFIAGTLLVGYVVAKLARDSRLLLAYPIALLAMDLFFLGLHLLVRWNGGDAARLFTATVASGAYVALLAWFLVAAFVLLLRFVPRRVAGAGFAVYLAVFAVSFWWLPPQDLWLARPGAGDNDSAASIADEAVFHAQPALLERDLALLEAERPGVPDLYFVGFGAYAHEDVFMKEVEAIGELFRERFDAGGRIISLINNPRTVMSVPLASATNLARALSEIGRVINREEDVLVLYITSHGTEQHRLSVVNAPLRLNEIDPPMLKQMLDQSGIKWRVLAISACFAGGFIRHFKDETTLIMTAADEKKQSFGCGAQSDFTYFGRAVFDEELRRTHSFVEAFERARRSIAEREREQKFEASNPQIHVGGAIAGKLREIESRLRDLAGARAAAQMDE